MARHVAMCDLYMAWIHAETGNCSEAVELFDAVSRSLGDLRPLMEAFEVAHGKGLAYFTAGRLESARKPFRGRHSYP